MVGTRSVPAAKTGSTGPVMVLNRPTSRQTSTPKLPCEAARDGRLCGWCSPPVRGPQHQRDCGNLTGDKGTADFHDGR
jgi:hypothetical protein